MDSTTRWAVFISWDGDPWRSAHPPRSPTLLVIGAPPASGRGSAVFQVARGGAVVRRRVRLVGITGGGPSPGLPNMRSIARFTAT